jgi:hypothetical protein
MDGVIEQNAPCLCHIDIGRDGDHLLLHNLVGMVKRTSFKIFGEHTPVSPFDFLLFSPVFNPDTA